MLRLIGLSLILTSVTGCASPSKQVEDATERSASWAVTVKAIAEQWEQSRVSQRFARTTIQTAVEDLSREADSVRSVDPATATTIDRLKSAIGPVMTAIAMNEPNRARDEAARLPSIIPPDPTPPTARPASAKGSGAAGSASAKGSGAAGSASAKGSGAASSQ